MESYQTHPTKRNGHSAVFYNTPEQLLEILVPFFMEGLDLGCYCVWLIAPSLRIEDAKAALQPAVGDVDAYVRKGQLEFIPAEEWYTDAGVFAANRSLEDFERRLKQAAAEGYQGVRASGDASWLPMRDWARFQDYERELHRRA